MKLEPFRLERYFAKYEFTAPYLLCCSDCESLSVEDLIQLEPAARDALHSLRLGYTESLGSPNLRETITSLYSNISPDQILVHSGAEEAIFNFMNVALEPGDDIVVQTPHYQSLGEVARGVGARVILWPAEFGRGWFFELDSLARMLTPKTKVVVVNFPHNPTGFVPEAEFVTELSRLSEQHGFLVFSDEVYRGLEYDESSRLPPFADMNERGVSLGVMSKTYGLAGLRIGWIATRNRKLFEQLASFKDYTTICNSAPSEFLAAIALRNRDSIVNRNLTIIRNNLAQLESFFAEHSDLFEWYAPKAGPIAFPRYLGKSVEVFCRRLVEDCGVLLLPGTLYGDDFDCFRIGFGRKNLPECLEKFEQFICNFA